VLAACVSPQQLEQMSAQQFAQMREEVPLSKSASQRAYVQCIADAIVAELPEPYASDNWDQELFADPAANAFAMPGGKIGVYDGLLDIATDQDQLAAVMGHEVAHVTLEHSIERANAQIATSAGLSIGAELFGISGGVVDAIAIGADLGLLRPYGRSQESEADLIGLEFMAKAGFNPRAAVPLWQNMKAAGGDAPPEWLSTHPSNETRIEKLQEAMANASVIYDQARAAGKRPSCGP
jgi:predicted Zn-dependent protease